jgi:hypothetical protein
MRPRLHGEIRRKVINDWLSGYSRDEISRRTGASTGTVSNIVNTLEQDLGKAEADALRELAKAIQLSPAQYVVGIRISNLSKRVGLDPKLDEIEQFLVNVCDECMSRGITPETIASHMEDLANIPGNVRLPELEQYRTKMTAEIKALGEQKCRLINDISEIAQQKLEAETALEQTLENKRMIEDELKAYGDAKQQLGIYDLIITDLQNSARTIRTIQERGYDPDTIIADINKVHSYDQNKEALTAELDDKTIKIQVAECRYSQLRDAINLYSQRLPAYEWFERQGVSGMDLKILFDKIIDVSLLYGIPFYVAFNKFFGDVCEQYGPKLGFESKIESLKSELAKLSKERQEEEKKLNNANLLAFNILFGKQPFDIP